MVCFISLDQILNVSANKFGIENAIDIETHLES